MSTAPLDSSSDRDDLADIDLKQTGARVRRTLVALAWGVLVAALTYGICWVFMAPAETNPYSGRSVAGSHMTGPWYVMGYFAGGAGFIAYAIAAWRLKRAHDRDNAILPPARVKKA